MLQNLNPTFTQAGNVVEVAYNTQQTHYFSNSVIEPKGMYKYDALYRLKEATGREVLVFVPNFNYVSSVHLLLPFLSLPLSKNIVTLVVDN